MADAVVTCTTSSVTRPCYVYLTMENSFVSPIFDLTVVEGGLIAGAVLAVWAVGYGFRVIIRSLNSDGVVSTESE